MRKYRNENAERKFPAKDWFYNFCIRVALERVSSFVALDALQRFGEKRFVKIIFSERGGHSYRHTETYQELLSIQGQKGSLFLDKRSVDWGVIHWKLMEAVSHKTSAGCQLADIVTSAFFQAADANRPRSWTTQNAEALNPIMAVEIKNESSYWADYGVTLMPWSQVDRRKLSDNQKRIFRFYGYVF
jgi:hypothetical protein